MKLRSNREGVDRDAARPGVVDDHTRRAPGEQVNERRRPSNDNGERYLLEQLESAENQTVLPNELVVIGDHSEDRTAEMAQRFAGGVSPCHNHCQQEKPLRCDELLPWLLNYEG